MERLLHQLQQQQEHLETSVGRREELIAVMEKYKNRDPDDLTEEERWEKDDAEKRLPVVRAMIASTEEQICNLETQIAHIEQRIRVSDAQVEQDFQRQGGTAARNQVALPAARYHNDNERLASVLTSDRSHRPDSVLSEIDSLDGGNQITGMTREHKNLIKGLEASAQGERIKVELQFMDKIAELEGEIEDDEEALQGAQPGPIVDELSYQVVTKKKKLMRLQQRFDKMVDGIHRKLRADIDALKYRAPSAGVKAPSQANSWSNQHNAEAATRNRERESRLDPQPVYQHRRQRSPSPTPSIVSVADPGRTRRTADENQVIMAALTEQLKLLREQKAGPSDKFLPEFNGDPAQWIKFKAHYDRTHRKFGFTNDENMTRLEKSLKGPAAKAVEHLMTNPKNVQAVLDALDGRYGRPEYIIDHLTEKVKACRRVDTRFPETTIEFGTCVSALVENIKTFKMPEYLRNAQLLREMLEKLPQSLVHDWMHYRVLYEVDASDIERFSKWLNVNVEAALMMQRPKVGRQTEKREEKSYSNSRGRVTIAAVEGQTQEKSFNSRTSECNVCHAKNHKIDSCWSLKKKSLDERWKLAREAGVCFSCLKNGHRTAECKEGKVCGIDGCTRKHHVLLHSKPSWGKTSGSSDGKTNKARNEQTTPSSAQEEKVTGNIGLSAAVEAAIIKGTDGPLPIVPVKIKCGSRVRKTHALLDSGATRTLITNDLAKDIGIQGKPIDFRYTTMSGGVVKEDNTKVVDFSIIGNQKGSKWHEVKEAITVKQIGLRPYSIDVDTAKLRWPHLKRFQGPRLRNVQPEIVIGSDHGYLTMHRELLYADPDQPIAVKTDLGWALQGKFGETNHVGSLFHLSGIDMDATLDKLITESFKLNNLGEKEDDSNSLSVQDKRALEIMETTTVRRDDGRWETGLLWKTTDPLPLTMYDESVSRLRKTESRMAKNHEFAKVYHNKINEYLHKGYIKKLSEQEAETRTNRTGFIPHFGVVNPNKPGKFRLVFDCAAVIEGKSFNDFLLTGPDLIRPLPAILWNFRRHKFVICGDIEDMFHRVFIREDDRQAQRFLWRDGDPSKKPDVYEMLVMIFGATSSPSCAIFVKNKNAEQFLETYPEATRAIREDFYIDDCLTGGDTEEILSTLRKEITDINIAGGFVIKKWLSNSKNVMESIPDALRLDGDQKSIGETERVLGLYWDPKKDVFTFRLNFNKVKPGIMAGERPTKRQMCGLIVSLFDPLGFVANFKIKAMILFQEVWKTGIGWDDPITDEVHVGWTKWVNQLNDLPHITIPRWYGNPTSVQLHTFVDASTEAMASVCFLRIQDGDEVKVTFATGKAKVAPTKKSTIPRLELCAALMGSQMTAAFLKETPIPIEKCVFWSDSSTALSWIKSDSARYKEFVANRVSKIQKLTNGDDWRWINTEDNPADDGTRSSKAADLTSESRWLTGPAFLKRPENEWPEKVVTETVCCAVIVEENVQQDEENNMYLDIVPDSARFSSYNRLLRATAAVIAAAEYWLQQIRKSKTPSPPWTKLNGVNITNFNAEHLKAAEIAVLRAAQKDIDLNNAQKILLTTKLLRDTDGVIRVQGRIADSVEGDVKRPILLPGDSRITELLIDAEHHKNLHCGRNTVFNLLRQRFFIPSGRNAVRRAWSRCLPCKLGKASPIFPEMGKLPDCRTNAYEPPFTYTGADLFGPMEVTVGRRHEKRWGLLLTCMVTRAVHIELLSGLSLDETMMGMSRFIDARGIPKHLYSDNGTNFVAAAKEIGKQIKYNGLTWHFIPPAAPHMGGAWETSVKQVERALHEVLKEKFPKEQVLLTAVKAVENVVNSRPLSYVSNDPNDDSALTPNHFLRGVGVASGDPRDITNNSADLCGEVTDKKEQWGKSWEKAQVLANRFWERWSREVLPDLLRRNKWNTSKEPVKVGDVVIMVDELKPRGQWNKAIVSETFPGKDSVVRVVEVIRRDPRTKTVHRFKRPVAKICPTGLSCSDLATVLEQVGKSGAGNGENSVEN